MTMTETQICSYCEMECLYPVELHHSEQECLARQATNAMFRRLGRVLRAAGRDA